MTDKLSSSPHPIRDAAEANPSRRRFVRHMGLAAAALGTLPLAACGGGDDAPAVQFAHGIVRDVEIFQRGTKDKWEQPG